MKKIIGSLIALTLFTVSVQAQIDRKTESHEKGRHGGGDMALKLNLTEEQKAQVKVINDDIRSKMMALKNSNTAGTDMSTQRQALMQEKRNRISAILTPEQKAKFAQQSERFGAKSEGRNQGSREGNWNKGGDDKSTWSKGREEGDHVNKMQSVLGLSDAQSDKLKESNQAFMNRMKAIKENTSLTQEQKMQQIKALQDEKHAYMKSILTPEQAAKFEQMKGNRGENFKEKHKSSEGKHKRKVKNS